MKLLLNRGADIEASTKGMTALEPALHYKHKEAVELLLKNCAKVTNKYVSNDVLLWGTKNGYEELVQQLLKRTADGIDPNHKDLYDRTPLSWAAEMGHEKLVRLLIRHGAQVESKDKHGQTPLFYAAGNIDGTIVTLLIAEGAQVETRDNYGRTALSRAEAHGRKVVVQVLAQNSHGKNMLA